MIKNVNSIIDFILGKETELNGHFYQLLRVDYFVKRTLKSKPRGMQNVSHIQRKGKMRGLWKIGDFSLENSWILWSCSTNFCVSTPFSCISISCFYVSIVYLRRKDLSLGFREDRVLILNLMNIRMKWHWRKSPLILLGLIGPVRTVPVYIFALLVRESIH